MEVILKHKTVDGLTYHEVDIVNGKHKVTILETDTTMESTTSKKWGTQQKFVEKLVTKELESVKEKIFTQKTTIADCRKYNSMGNLEITERKLNMNEELLGFLTMYEYK